MLREPELTRRGAEAGSAIRGHGLGRSSPRGGRRAPGVTSPRRTQTDPTCEDRHEAQRGVGRARVPEARVPRRDAHPRPNATVIAEGRVVEALHPAVCRTLVPPIGSALDVRVLVEEEEGVLHVHDVNVRHQHRAAHREELAHVHELLRRDLVRARRPVDSEPVRHLVLLEPPRQVRVDCDDHHVPHAGAAIGVDPLGQLPRHRRVAHRHHHFALDRRRPQDLAQLLAAVAVLRPL
eukprot:7377502-Prymnesium_polylepis.1